MDTRRFRRSSRSDAVAAFRWLGWVMLMMFVLVQTAHAATGSGRVQVDTAAPQKRAIVLSSGTDSFSQANFRQVLEAAEDSGVPICPINIGPLLKAAVLPAGEGSNDAPYGHLEWQRASQQLSRLARVSGCRAVTPSSSMELPAVYDGLLANLRLKYVIRYRSTALNLPGTREVRVEWTDGTRSSTRVAHTNIQSNSAYKVFADTRYKMVGQACTGPPCLAFIN